MNLAKEYAKQKLPETIPVSQTEYGVDTHAGKRRAVGKILLAFFLRDAVIHGLSPEGRLFRHRASETLCRKFRNGMLKVFSTRSRIMVRTSRALKEDRTDGRGERGLMPSRVED